MLLSYVVEVICFKTDILRFIISVDAFAYCTTTI